jgi:hypothetical protein
LTAVTFSVPLNKREGISMAKKKAAKKKTTPKK